MYDCELAAVPPKMPSSQCERSRQLCCFTCAAHLLPAVLAWLMFCAFALNRLISLPSSCLLAVQHQLLVSCANLAGMPSSNDTIVCPDMLNSCYYLIRTGAAYSTQRSVCQAIGGEPVQWCGGERWPAPVPACCCIACMASSPTAQAAQGLRRCEVEVPSCISSLG